MLGKHPIFVRTSHDVYLEKASLFIEEVVSQVKDLQFYTADGSKGGPIIMTQVSKNWELRFSLFQLVPFLQKYSSTIYKNHQTYFKAYYFRLRMNMERLVMKIIPEILNICIV